MVRLIGFLKDVAVLFLIFLIVVQPTIYPLLAGDDENPRPKLSINEFNYDDPLWYELENQALNLGDQGPSKHSLDLFRLLIQRTALAGRERALESARDSARKSKWNADADAYEEFRQESREQKSAVGVIESAVSKLELDNLTLVIRNDEGAEIGRLFARDFTSFMNDYGKIFSDGSSFEIQFQDVPLHYFGSPKTGFPLKIRSAMFHDGKLFFVEEGNFNSETGISTLSFIDLNYFASAVGRTDLPIFKLPIKSGKPLTKLTRILGELYADEMPLPKEVVNHVSSIQQTAWNLSVSLADPTTAGSAAEVVSDFTYYFEKSVELAGKDVQQQIQTVVGDEAFHGDFKAYLEDQLKARVNSFEAKAKADEAVDEFEKDKKLWKQRVKAGETDLPPPVADVDMPSFPRVTKKLEASFSAVAENLKAQRSLMGRMRYLWARLTLPQPMGAPKVETALKLIRNGILGELDPSVSRARDLNEGLRQLINLRPVKMIGGAFALALFLHMGQDLVGSVLSQFLEASGDMLSLGWQSFHKTISGFSLSANYHQYIANGRAAKVLVGGTAAFSLLFMVLGLPHFIVNSYKLYQDLRSRPENEKLGNEAAEDLPAKESWWSKLKSLPSRFIARQKKEEADYLEALSASSYLNNNDRTFTKRDDENVKRILDELNAQRSNWVGRFFKGMTQWKIVKMLRSNPDSFLGALRHFIFSSASLTHSGSIYAKMWNSWFGFRSFVFHPRLWMTFIYYPNYWQRVFNKGKNGLAMPTEANGGLRPFWEEEWLRFHALFDRQAYKVMKAAEEKLVSVEAEIQKIVLKRSFGALLRHIDAPEDLKQFFETNGVDSITDETIFELSSKHRSFFQLYFWQLQEEATAEFLREKLGSEDALRTATSDDLSKILCSSEEAEIFVDRVLAARPNFEAEVTQRVETNDKAFENFWIRFQMKNFKKLDPKFNRQVARMKLAVRQMNNPQAMARAVRATKAAILVDKPLELFMRFILLAAIDTGIMVPMHDEMFSENSWFYLGRYPFLTGYVVALIQGVLADIWMKIQTDAKNEGTFGEVPEGKDKNLSFLQWYRKQTFHNPKNKWWDNQKYNNSIVWANMKAALVTYLVFNMLTLGRFDLDAYFSGYLLYFLTPLSGFALMIEQGFEFASFYYAKDIPKRYRNHPEVEKYLNSRIGSARIWFNLYYKIYENFTGLWLDAMQTVATAANGTRAFVRILLFGYTPTELVGNSLDKVGEVADFIPGAKKCAGALRKVITHNYTDGTKLTSPP